MCQLLVVNRLKTLFVEGKYSIRLLFMLLGCDDSMRKSINCTSNSILVSARKQESFLFVH